MNEGDAVRLRSLLRLRRERPSGCTADKCDEFASPHWLALKQRGLPYHAVGCIVHHGKFWPPMSALGQKQTSDDRLRHVRFTPKSGHR